jgi:hypothetical protein
LEYRRRGTAQLDAVVGQLASIGTRAVSVLRRALDDEDPAIRPRAAMATLNSLQARINSSALSRL